MYHYITVWGLTIHMTGLGIVAFLVVFLSLTHYEAKRNNLDSREFMKYIPLYIIIMYLLGSYVYYLIEEMVVLPFSFKQLLLYITPYKYAFHSIGITLWAIIGARKFLKEKDDEEKRKWINIRTYSLLWALIPLGVFLVLGDTFIGKATEGSLYVSAIRSDSAVAIYDKVLPLWLWISLTGVIGWWAMYIIGRKTHPYRGLNALWILSLIFSIIFLFQQYPRRVVSSVWWVTFDIKQYFFIALAIFFFVLWFNQKKRA